MNGAFRFLKFKLNSVFEYRTLIFYICPICSTGCDVYYVFRLCHNSIHYSTKHRSLDKNKRQRERKKRIENV